MRPRSSNLVNACMQAHIDTHAGVQEHHARACMQYLHVRKYAMAIAHACTMAILHACNMAVVHACTMPKTHASTMATRYACTMAMVHACTMAMINTCSMAIWLWKNPRGLHLHTMTQPFEYGFTWEPNDHMILKKTPRDLTCTRWLNHSNTSSP